MNLQITLEKIVFFITFPYRIIHDLSNIMFHSNCYLFQFPKQWFFRHSRVKNNSIMIFSNCTCLLCFVSIIIRRIHFSYVMLCTQYLFVNFIAQLPCHIRKHTAGKPHRCRRACFQQGIINRTNCNSDISSITHLRPPLFTLLELF